MIVSSESELFISFSLIGTSGNDDGDAMDDVQKKILLYFIFEFRSCMDLFRAPISLTQAKGVMSALTYGKIRENSSQELSHFTSLFCRGWLRNVQIYTAIVLLIKSFVW